MKTSGTDRRNLGITSGDSVLVNITIHNADRTLPDLTSSAITYKVALTPKSETLLTKSIGSGISVTGAGRLRLTFDPADTADLVGDDYYHELRSTSSSGAVTTLMYGTLTIRDDLT